MVSQAVEGSLLEALSAPNEATPSFNQFPELPLELRRKIWRYAFPKPRILKNLSLDKYGCWRREPFSFHVSHPVTLFINRESRTETLKSYRDLSTSLDTSGKPVYFSPAYDALHLGSVICFTEAFDCVQYLAEHTVQIIDQLSHIQVLILDRLFMDATYRKFLLRDHSMVRWPVCRDAACQKQKWRWDGDGAELEGGILVKFHGLKKLFLTMKGWTDGLGDRAAVEDCKKLFRSYFEIEKQKWPDCNIPEIVVILPGETLVWPE